MPYSGRFYSLLCLLLCASLSTVLSSTQTEFECECSYSTTQKAYLVSMTRTSDTDNQWIGVYDGKTRLSCSNAVVSSSTYVSDIVLFPSAKSGVSYQCVLWEGKGSLCSQIGIVTFTCPLNTTSTSSNNTRRFLNLLIIIPAIFLLTFLIAALIRRLRTRYQHSHATSSVNSHQEYELTPYSTTASTVSQAPPTYHAAHNMVTATQVAPGGFVPYATAAYPGGMAVLHPYTPVPFVHQQPQFLTNVFPVGVPQTNMVYVSEGEVMGAQLSPLYVATTTPQQRF